MSYISAIDLIFVSCVIYILFRFYFIFPCHYTRTSPPHSFLCIYRIFILAQNPSYLFLLAFATMKWLLLHTLERRSLGLNAKTQTLTTFKPILTFRHYFPASTGIFMVWAFFFIVFQDSKLFFFFVPLSISLNRILHTFFFITGNPLALCFFIGNTWGCVCRVSDFFFSPWLCLLTTQICWIFKSIYNSCSLRWDITTHFLLSYGPGRSEKIGPGLVTMTMGVINKGTTCLVYNFRDSMQEKRETPTPGAFASGEEN